MNLVERIRQRIEVFQPGGDNEKLLKEAADQIEILEDRCQQLMSILDEHHLFIVKKIAKLRQAEPN